MGSLQTMISQPIARQSGSDGLNIVAGMLGVAAHAIGKSQSSLQYWEAVQDR